MEDSNSLVMIDVELGLCIFWILRAYNEQQNNYQRSLDFREKQICYLHTFM
jgi:hypothetical protein